MRRYWQPVALSEELPPGGSPLSVKLLGEEFVLFRDDRGRPGLLDIHCPHRGADLSYGRVEDGGIRCIYHGWLFDIQGACLDQPGEPAGSDHYKSIRQKAYPCIEKSGMVFTYLGPGEPPLFPNYDFLTCPEDHVFATKLYTETNFLQANEGNIDLIHNNFVHFVKRDLEKLNPNEAREALERFGAPQVLSGRGPAPGLEITDAQLLDYGVRIYKIRKMEDGGHYIRVATYLLPNLTVIPAGNINWHVPIDDRHHWKYIIRFDRENPIDKEKCIQERKISTTPDYRPVANKQNRYLQDRESMKTTIYSGISPTYFQAQDLCPIEGAGFIQDRTREHLVKNDIPIVISRKLLSKAIQNLKDGLEPRNVVRKPENNRFPEIVALFGPVPKSKTHREYCDRLAAENRGWQTRQR
jgi:phenylpropionate dioxygenase-like ring-hydroxylating dioxygenase large terminal subunit